MVHHPLAATLSPPSTSHINAQISSLASTSATSTPSIGISRDLSPSTTTPSTTTPSTSKQSRTNSQSPVTPSSFDGAPSSSLYDFSEEESRDSVEFEGGALLRASVTAPSSVAPSSNSTQSIPSTSRANNFTSLSRTTSLPPGETFPIVPSVIRSTPRLRSSRPRSPSVVTGFTPPSQSFRFVPINNPPSNPNPSPPSASSSLQSHLYTSGLLNSSLSDVHIIVFEHFYRLHRILLNQSGYFSSLFQGGFSESHSRPVKRGESNEVIELEMSKPMTRAAFEFCLTMLYGGSSILLAPPWSTTTTSFPLSASFERLYRRASGGNWDRKDSVGVDEVIEARWKALVTENVQAATPTFLLSLLATTTYLEISTLQKKTMDLILDTITPFSVGQYLGFALGNALGPRTTTNDFEKGCRGLEGVGIPYNPSQQELSPYSSNQSLDQSDSTATSTHSIVSSSSSESSEDPSSLIFVGPEGIRIGKACASFLANKGSQILAVEEWLQAGGNSKEYDSIPDFLQSYEELLNPELRVWSSKDGGLSSRWIKGLISSDAFFLGKKVNGGRNTEGINIGDTGGEFERYRFAKRVVELRRREKKVLRTELAARWKGKGKEGTEEEVLVDLASAASLYTEEGNISQDESRDSCFKITEGVSFESGQTDEEVDRDEVEYLDLFTNGIYYSHLTFKQLLFISQDISPTTGLPYTPQATINSALWATEEFKTRIPLGPLPFSAAASHATYSGFLPPRVSTTTDDIGDTPVLGLAASTSPSLLEEINRLPTTRFFLIPTDDTVKINDSDHRSGPSSPSPTLIHTPTRISADPESFFGLQTCSKLGVKGAGVFVGEDELEDTERQFTPYEPCRFSAQFYNVSELREKQRLYSDTFFYAGSSYNVYLQRISSTRNKSAQQLGLYLHRQSQLELFPSPNTPTRGSVGSVLSDMSSPPYVDRRKEIQAYFSIWVGNQQSNSLTRYGSSPSSFATSQSWGWKSSSLASCVDLEGISPSEQNSMRVTVVLGLV